MIHYEGHIIINTGGTNYRITGGYGRNREISCFGDITYNRRFNTEGLVRTESGEFTLYTNTTTCKITKEELIEYLDEVKKIAPFKYNISWEKGIIGIEISFGSINRLQFLALSTLVRLVHEEPFNFMVRDYIYLRRKLGFIRLGFIKTLYVISCAYPGYNSNHFMFYHIDGLFSTGIPIHIKDLEYKEILESSKSNMDKLNNAVSYIHIDKNRPELNISNYGRDLDNMYKHVHLPNLKIIKNLYKKYK